MKQIFSERFSITRQNKGYTQKQLAEKLGVTSQAISKWETGSSLPDIEMLNAIAIILDCSLDYLTGHKVTETSRINLQSVERRDAIEKAISKAILELRVGSGLVDILLAEQSRNFEAIHLLRLRLAAEYGICVPLINLKDVPALAENEYCVLLHGTEEVARGKASSMETMTDALEKVILEKYDKILNRQLVADMVDIVRKNYPVIVEGIVPEKISYSFLQKIISMLVTDGRPINRLDYIIEYLEEHIGETDSSDKLYEELKEHIPKKNREP